MATRKVSVGIPVIKEDWGNMGPLQKGIGNLVIQDMEKAEVL